MSSSQIVGSSPVVKGVTPASNGTTAVVVPCPAVTANSQILLTVKTPGGATATAYGSAVVSSVTAGTGFTILALAGDASTYNYLVLNP